MMVNVDNTNSSSVGFGLEDLPLLNNNNNEAEAKSEDDIRSIDKVSFKTDDACPNTQPQLGSRKDLTSCLHFNITENDS